MTLVLNVHAVVWSGKMLCKTSSSELILFSGYWYYELKKDKHLYTRQLKILVEDLTSAEDHEIAGFNSEIFKFSVTLSISDSIHPQHPDKNSDTTFFTLSNLLLYDNFCKATEYDRLLMQKMKQIFKSSF